MRWICLSLAAALPAQEIDFGNDIAPLLRDRCVRCHGPDLRKGDLRLDRRDSVFHEDEDLWVIRPGDPEDSELIRRVALPADDEEAMPREGERLTRQDVDALRRWIRDGADWPTAHVIEPPPLQDDVLPAATNAQIRERDRAIERLASETELRVYPLGSITNAIELVSSNTLAHDLNGLEPFVYRVDLSGTTQRGASALRTLASLEQLRVLDLSRCAVDSAAIANIAAAPMVEVVRLAGSDIDDTAARALLAAPSLRVVYLWNTRVTPAGIDALRAARPNVRFDTGEAARTLGQDPEVGIGAPPPTHAVRLIEHEFPMAMRFERTKDPLPRRSPDDVAGAREFVEVGHGSGDLVSTTLFGDARLHVEWLSPPGGSGQGAGNSGVYLQDRYELQILATPKAPHPPQADEAGALYRVKAADSNASTGPGAWQAFDIWFRAPRFGDGEKTENARVTVRWNGVLIHDDVELEAPTGAGRARGESAGPDHRVQLGRLRLQDHTSGADGPVRFRNVWIAPPEVPTAKPGEWVELFEDSDWAPRGGRATYRLDEDGRLSGFTAPSTPNTFYTSAATYADFELTWEAKVHSELNSGVQIRSHVHGGFDNRDGGLIGYQIEFDPSDRSYSAGIYDERRRGWLHDLSARPAARAAFIDGEWNRFRVVAIGPVIRTWINDAPAAEILDATTPAGHIGFQVHGVGKREDELDVHWRNVRLRRFE